jgi:multisubunit Na+/H+ antiporter MnhB subunit
MNATSRAWLADILIGGLAGGVVGAIAAVNFVIYVGIEDGYEASIPEVFRQNTLAGIVTVAILLMGSVVGLIAVRRRRRSRTQSGSE